MTEAQLQQAVIEAARLLGWKVAHFRPARTKHGWRTPVAADGAGWPDLVLLRGDRIIFAELKQDGKKPNPEQQAWLDGLGEVGEVCVWCPADWLRGHIDQVLLGTLADVTAA